MDNIDEIKQLTKELGDAKAKHEKQTNDLLDAHKEVTKALEAAAKLDKEKAENIDKAITSANETAKSVNELAQKIDELKKAATARPAKITLRSVLAKALEADKTRFGQFQKHEVGKLNLVLKDTVNIDTTTAAGLLAEPYIDTLVSMEKRPLRVRDLLTVIPVTTDSVKYGKQSVRTNAAAIVAEGTAKPYSTYAWIPQTAAIETIAHLAKLTLQAIADAPRLVAEIEAEMLYGLALVEDSEIVSGDGSSGHLSGLLHNATAYALPADADAGNVLNDADKLRAAVLQLALANVSPDGFILNPVDMFNIRLARDDNSNYIFGAPNSDSAIASLWGVRVVETASIATGQFLAGAFKYSANLYDRDGANVLISTENDDDFEKNLATMRCESRLGLAVRRPYGIVKGSFAAGS